MSSMKRVVEVRRVSIVQTEAPCVVNASNESGTLGGGVSRAIFTACGGSVLQDEMSAKLEAEYDGLLESGDCLVTSGGASETIRWVLHVPSVDYREKSTRSDSSLERVRECTQAALQEVVKLARKEGAPLAVTFPLLGAGSGGLAPGQSMRAMIEGLRAFFQHAPDAPVFAIYFAVPEEDRFAVCQKALASAFG